MNFTVCGVSRGNSEYHISLSVYVGSIAHSLSCITPEPFGLSPRVVYSEYRIKYKEEFGRGGCSMPDFTRARLETSCRRDMQI